MAEDAEDGSVGGGNCEVETVKKLPLTTKNSNRAIGYLIPIARLAFTQLKKVFTKAPILWYFDPEYYIRIETDVSGYAIGRVLSQLTLNNLGWWNPVAFYTQKMIPAKIQYKTHNGELLAIVETFKTWRHYLKGCKHKVLLLTNHNNLYCFIDMKSLNSRQVWWAQKLSRYHFWINYCRGKANKAANALSCFPQRSLDKKKKLWAQNFQIFHWLKALLINASLSSLNVSLSSLSPLHQVLICKTYALPQLRQFWSTFSSELVNKSPYQASIGSMRLKLQKLQETNSEAQKLQSKEGFEEVKGVLHHQGLLFMPEAIQTELISRHHNDPLASHFGIKKTCELLAQKYFSSFMRHDVEA